MTMVIACQIKCPCCQGILSTEMIVLEVVLAPFDDDVGTVTRKHPGNPALMYSFMFKFASGKWTGVAPIYGTEQYIQTG
jgi:hypothetical protein